MGYYFNTLIALFIISIISLIGIISIFIKKNILKKGLFFLIAFSIGTLLGNAFFHLIPESIKYISQFTTYLIVIFGILFFFILEKIICWRHCHIEISKKHHHQIGYMPFIGDSIHNLIDGAIIASSFLISNPLGIVTTIAVILHEIPQEIGDFSIMLYAGFEKTKAIFLNFLSALFAFLGAIIILYLKINFYYLLPFAAGGFIYIASSDLIPELHKQTKITKTITQIIGILFGILIMIFLLYTLD